MLINYRNELTKMINSKEYDKAFEYLVRLIPNLSVNELEELSNYYIHFLYLKNIKSKL